MTFTPALHSQLLPVIGNQHRCPFPFPISPNIPHILQPAIASFSRGGNILCEAFVTTVWKDIRRDLPRSLPAAACRGRTKQKFMTSDGNLTFVFMGASNVARVDFNNQTNRVIYYNSQSNSTGKNNNWTSMCQRFDSLKYFSRLFWYVAEKGQSKSRQSRPERTATESQLQLSVRKSSQPVSQWVCPSGCLSVGVSVSLVWPQQCLDLCSNGFGARVTN